MSHKAWDYYQDFVTWDIKKQNQELQQRSPDFWPKMGAQKALEVFQAASVRVPAYRKFLKEHDVNPKHIKSVDDFKHVPPVGKKNYLRAYPLAELCWDGDMTRMNVISVSSGSTGKPFYWPRDIWQEHEVDHWYELLLRYVYETHKQHTLLVIAYAMGMYIAGPFTFSSGLRIAQKGYPLALASPSSNIDAVLDVLANVSPNFKQTLIGGYPPLVKEILDRGAKAGINWHEKNIKLFFGGEGFSEKWRDYVLHHVSPSHAYLTTAMNMYGTADSALLGMETPVSIAFRRLIDKNREERLTTVCSERLPSVLSYNPLFKYFEAAEDHELLFTSSSGVPLIRYQIGDVGGLIPFQQVSDTMDRHNQSLESMVQSQRSDLPVWRLPLVYLFGRSDFTVQMFGANVYPENIKEALDHRQVAPYVSGKFILETKYRSSMSPYLDLKIELAPNTPASIAKTETFKSIIVSTLRARNSEYEVIYQAIKKKAEPVVKLIPYGHNDFKINIKHRWVKQKPPTS